MDIERAFLLPVIYTQGLWVAARAMQMPEPDGPRSGVTGQGPDLRLLIIGDSSAAGVGVPHQDQALSGQTVAQLAKDHCVAWRVIAASGATANDTVKRLQTTEPAGFDVALIALGVNDSKNGVAAHIWSQNYARVLHELSSRFGVQHVVACGLPPVQDFPLLPDPLRAVLARRARRFDALLQSVVATHEGASYLAAPLRLDPAHMAADGFHPGAEIYAEWGRQTSAAIRSRFKNA